MLSSLLLSFLFNALPCFSVEGKLKGNYYGWGWLIQNKAAPSCTKRILGDEGDFLCISPDAQLPNLLKKTLWFWHRNAYLEGNAKRKEKSFIGFISCFIWLLTFLKGKCTKRKNTINTKTQCNGSDWFYIEYSIWMISY